MKVKVSFSSILKVWKLDLADLYWSLIISSLIFTLGDGPVISSGPRYHGRGKSFDGAAEPEVGAYLDPHLLLVQGDSGGVCNVGY